MRLFRRQRQVVLFCPRCRTKVKADLQRLALARCPQCNQQLAPGGRGGSREWTTR